MGVVFVPHVYNLCCVVKMLSDKFIDITLMDSWQMFIFMYAN